MLDWLFKKYSHSVKSPPDKTTERAADKRKAAALAAAQAANAAATLSPEPKKPAAPEVDWAAQLQAAQGDDAALLAVAQNATVLDIKLAAVQALSGEATLKLAERAFRNHDRKVHRLAKQRMEAAVQQRTSRATAQLLLEQTQKLLQEPQLAINQLVELDKSWQALPAHALEASQTSAFAELRARLNTQMLARSNAEQQLTHWTADSKALLAACPARLLAATEPGQTETALALSQELQALIHAQPAVETAGPAQVLTQALALALTQAQAVHAHLQLLDTVPGPTDELPVDPSANLALNPAVREALSSRHRQWQQLHRPAPAPQAQTPRAAAERPPKPPRAQPLDAEQQQALENLLLQAEAALADGQLGEMQRQLQAMDALLTQARAVLPESLRERHQALWAEQGRLKDWQQWGGARARDDLADEAQALARQTLPVEIAPPEAAREAPPAEPAASPTVLPPPKLNLKAHNESIRTLRQRWKELDRHGAPATQAQWQRFDAALQVAYAPVAAQVAANKQARELNLSEREALLATLEALQLPTGEGDGALDWKALTREMDRFQTAWRKLGPPEHTAPHAAQKGLQTRLQEALARLEVPLQAARANAAAQREQLIARAEQLSPSSPHGSMPSEAARQVRDLQAQWQDQSRQLPLPRGLENALWARFKTATDAVFAQREASFAARDAELAANLAHAEALINRLQALSEATALPEVESTLAEVDKAWRQGGELPRGAGQALEPRYRAARDRAWTLVNQAQQQQWLTQCSTLASKLQLCTEREALAPAAPAQEALLARWAALPPLPAAWEQPLAQRWARAANSAGLSQPALEDVLLRLEMALGLPATAQQQAARQQLKLRALKEAMEGRSATTDGPAQQLAWWQSALKQGELQPEQALRLQALLAALQTAPAGTLLPR
jgi:DNA repair protein SbcC/Rad50